MRLLDQRVHAILARQVAGDRGRAGVPREIVQHGLLAARDRNRRAFLDEAARHHLSHVAFAAGANDQGALALQSRHPCFSHVPALSVPPGVPGAGLRKSAVDKAGLTGLG